MKKLLTIVLMVLLFAACGKDKFQTKPSLKIKSISGNIVPVNSAIRFTLEFTDKEGDVYDSIFVKKIRLNKRVVTTLRDSFGFAIPEFPNAPKGEIDLTLDFQSALSALNPPNIIGSNPPKKEPDSLLFKFYVQDKKKNKSDTVTTEMIQILRQ
jgi:hypothetical protein